jgi:hypothetical protein
VAEVSQEDRQLGHLHPAVVYISENMEQKVHVCIDKTWC